jgi:hypothetical protein
VVFFAVRYVLSDRLLEGYQHDVALYADLSKFRGAVGQLLEKVDDTLMQVGSEAYAGSLLVYQMAQTMGVGVGEGLDESLDDMGKRFARKLKATTPPHNATFTQLMV